MYMTTYSIRPMSLEVINRRMTKNRALSWAGRSRGDIWSLTISQPSTPDIWRIWTYYMRHKFRVGCVISHCETCMEKRDAESLQTPHPQERVEGKFWKHVSNDFASIKVQLERTPSQANEDTHWKCWKRRMQNPCDTLLKYSFWEKYQRIASNLTQWERY
jgi:hypothetical protein